MKKLSLALILVSILLLSSCSSGVPQEDFDSLQAGYDSLQADYDSLQTDYNNLSSNNEELQQKLDVLQEEYDSYKEKMEPYENLEAAEAEARQIEADKLIAEQKAAEEAAAAEAAAALAAEEAKGYETGITYDNIARNPDDYIGKKVKFSGKVIQVIESSETVQIRLAINNDYNKVVFCEYDPSITDSRILEEDTITIYGTSEGTITYQSTIGGQITVPGILIQRIDQ